MAFANNNADAAEAADDKVRPANHPPRSNDVLKMLRGDDDADDADVPEAALPDADDSGLLDILLKSFLDSKHQQSDDPAKKEDEGVLMAGIKILQARRDEKRVRKQAEQAEKATTKAGEAADEAKANPEFPVFRQVHSFTEEVNQVEEEKKEVVAQSEAVNNVIAVHAPNIIYNESEVTEQKAVAEQKAEDDTGAFRGIVSTIGTAASTLVQPAERRE